MKKIIVELGCGLNKRKPNAIGVDILNLPTVDIVADLNNGLPFFEDSSIDEIYSHHVLEHIDNLIHLIADVYRVLKPGGVFYGEVPHFSNPYFYSDPTHKNFFGIYTFSYFSKQSFYKRDVPHFYFKFDFVVEFIFIKFKTPFDSRIRRVLKKNIETLVNKNKSNQELYEEMFAFIFPAYEIHFKMRKP